LISLFLVFAGCGLAIGRIRRYRRESAMRRNRAFSEMRKIGKNQGEGRGAQGAE
jgi:hypothetical protein